MNNNEKELEKIIKEIDEKLKPFRGKGLAISCLIALPVKENEMAARHLMEGTFGDIVQLYDQMSNANKDFKNILETALSTQFFIHN